MKFSIRDLLLVTVIVAILTAWGIDHRRQANEIKKLREPDYVTYGRGGQPDGIPNGDY